MTLPAGRPRPRAVALVARFDDYPRQPPGDARQPAAELDHEVNVRTHREIDQIDAVLRTVIARLARLETSVRQGGRA